MRQRKLYAVTLATLTLGVLPACAPKITVEEMKQMRPQRPAELDRLNDFVGTWSTTGTASMMGLDEPIEATGTSTTAWDLDGWVLVEHNEFQMGEIGSMKGMGTWTYDPTWNRYHTSWFDNWGGRGKGTVSYNKNTGVWTMRAKGSSPMGRTRGKGTITFLDENTMEWTWREWPAWDWLGLFRIVEFQGTSTRQ